MAPRIARPLSMALALACALGASSDARADELKLVLTPEDGSGLPARVCLATRSPETAQARGEPGITALTDLTTCDADGRACAVPRGAPAAGCAQCPEATHPDCRAEVVTGRFPPADWTVVCADDDAFPADGGTVYIGVEPVEAQNPPALYAIEVSGGRIRWSPMQPLAGASYRVLGGDFEASTVSYPRDAVAAEWVQVPVRRRCRCVETRQPTGGEPITTLRVDDHPACRGAVSADGRLPVEVPANRPGRSRTLTAETAHSTATARWLGRWPPSDIEARLTRFAFDLEPACALPRPDICPTVGHTRATCEATPADGRCHYRCAVDPGAAVELPTPLALTLDAPERRWSQTLGRPGERLHGALPASDRVLTVELPPARFDHVGDRIEAVQISRQGVQTERLLVGPRGPATLHLPMPDLQCDAPLTVTYEGDRTFHPLYRRVEPGARLTVPPPAALGDLSRTTVAFGLGYGYQGTEGPAADLDLASDTLIALSFVSGLRFRAYGAPWFAELRVEIGAVPEWLVASSFEVMGETFDRRFDAFALLGRIELLFGWTFDLARTPLDLYLGPGVGQAYFVDVPDYLDVDLAKLLTLTAGLRWPIDGAKGRLALFAEGRGALAWQDAPIIVLDAAPDGADIEAVSGDLSPTFVSEHFVEARPGEAPLVWSISLITGLSFVF